MHNTLFACIIKTRFLNISVFSPNRNKILFHHTKLIIFILITTLVPIGAHRVLFVLCCLLKNPTVISIWLLVGFHPATRSVQSTPADNTRKRVWQYIEKERKKACVCLLLLSITLMVIEISLSKLIMDSILLLKNCGT